MNLAVNARDAMPQGGKLLLKIEKMKLEKDYTKGAFNIRAGFYTAICFEKGCCYRFCKGSVICRYRKKGCRRQRNYSARGG
ncbi:MAG: hypothetical protein J7K04_00985 [Spirochaetales bacterium]|nr:hypothetical protein [Spirochaetales bacterium]